MGLLEQMRSSSDSTFMQVVLAMVVVAFVLMYARQDGQRVGEAANVNGVRIMDTELNRSYRSQLSRAEQQRGRTLSDPEQQQLRDQVRQQLIQDEVLRQEAVRLGLEVSDDEVAREMVRQFTGDDGKYSAETYERYLKYSRQTDDAFKAQLRKDLLVRKLRGVALMSVGLSEADLKEAYRERETQVSLKMVQVRPAAFEKEFSVTEQMRADWLAQNASQVQETYDQDFKRLYDHPEQVRISMIRLAVVPEGPPLADLVPMLTEVREKIEKGADFAEMARKWSEDPTAADGGALGLRPVDQLSLQDSDALADLATGEMTKVFSTDTDVRLLRLEERVAAYSDSLEEVRDEIADRLITAEKIRELAYEFASVRLLPAWKERAEVPEELLAAYDMAATSTGLISTQQQGFTLFGPPQELLDASREAEVGQVLDKVFESNGIYFVAQLEERTEPDMEKFDNEKDRIREGALAQERGAFMSAWVDHLVSMASIR